MKKLPLMVLVFFIALSTSIYADGLCNVTSGASKSCENKLPGESWCDGRLGNPISKLPSVCEDGICEIGELGGASYGQITTCSEDCGYEINPFYADVSYCRDSSGVKYPSTGDKSASWFAFNGCAREKQYQVNKGEKLRIRVYTDSCSGCVCYRPTFNLYVYINGSWILSKYFNLPNVKGLETNEYYIPNSDKIKIVTINYNCFYMDVFTVPLTFVSSCDSTCAFYEEACRSDAYDDDGLSYTTFELSNLRVEPARSGPPQWAQAGREASAGTAGRARRARDRPAGGSPGSR
jgi:hypothetical protein